MSGSTPRENVQKLLDQLIKEERRGQRFYAEAAKFVSEPRSRSTFEWLALEENQHVDVLVNLKRRLLQPEGVAPSGSDDASRVEESKVYYLDFPEMEDESLGLATLPEIDLFKLEEFERLIKESSVGAILKLAMKIEYDATTYLANILKQVRTARFRKLLIHLIEEEKSHFLAARTRYDRVESRGKKTIRL